MFSKLDSVVERFLDLERQLASPDVVNNAQELSQLSKERSELEEIVLLYQAYKKNITETQGNKELLEESDFRDLAKEELKRLEKERHELEQKLKVALLPQDPCDKKDIILEIRAGAGGDESSLFAGELFILYKNYAISKGFTVSVASFSVGTKGGFKEITATIEGHGAYSVFKYEAGVHRVQRVPETETQGRVHTSTTTVAILVEPEEVEIEILDKDLRIDTYRAGGAGGQHVNKTDSAVRLTHMPSGIVVQCQDERSQIKNRSKAMKILRAKLYELKLEKQTQENAELRRSMVGTGDRSEKIRTYNFPQDRCTDHRIGQSFHNLPSLMQGNVEDLFSAIHTYYQAELLKGENKNDQARS